MRLSSEQIKAVEHIGSHARLLAGPGSGKTKILTQRVISLNKSNIQPEKILLLTFTRMAAAQLREEIKTMLSDEQRLLPQVSTLHAFALKQILNNSKSMDTLQKPIRIGNDWEERYIIQEDIKSRLEEKRVSTVQTLIKRLSANWETLEADKKTGKRTSLIHDF